MKEHVDYEVVYTAGSLLAHYGFAELEKLIHCLKINRHAIVLMDSDRGGPGEKPKYLRVNRVVAELENTESFAWTTHGKEIENYIPAEALRAAFPNLPELAVSQFASVYEAIKEAGGSDRTGAKVEMANDVCRHLTRDMLAAHSDLGENLEVVCERLRKWNYRSGRDLRVAVDQVRSQ